MNRRFYHWLTCVAALAFHLSGAGPAHAAPKDAQATKLADDAINIDYLATNFAEAEKKLRRGITLCAGTTNCSPQVRARLHRDLGVVLVAGLNRAEDGKTEFGEALKADPNVTLDKDLTTPEIDQAFQAARGGGSASPGAPAQPAKPPAVPGATATGGDMIHTPPAEQAALTPVPIYVELPDGVDATKVIARYRAFGSTEWKTLELHKMGTGFGGEIPCVDIGSATGDLSYYVQAFGAAGDVVSTTGSRAAPNKVPIKNQLSGEPPHLPGRPAPAQCADAANCPPGLPGCSPGKKPGKGWGASCERDSECGPGLACKNLQCDTGEKTGGDTGESSTGRSCESNADCNGDEKCNADKVCEGPAPKKFWLSLNVQQDLSIVSGVKDVCGNPTTGIASQIICLADDGLSYQGIPDFNNGNAIKGGLHVATTRILAGGDLLMSANVSLGLRLGYTLRIAPDIPFTASLHIEGRVTYWTGKDPFRRTGVRPYLSVMGGIAEVDDKFETQISETKPTDPRQDIKPTQTLTVWRRTGGGFLGGAAGIMIPVSASSGVLVELKVQAMLPNSGVSLSPSLGYAIGL